MIEEFYRITNIITVKIINSNILQEELPNSQFQPILELLRIQDCPGSAAVPKEGYGSYTNHLALEEMHEAISSVIEKEIINKIQSSQFIGIIIDESTDRSNYKRLIIYFTHINNGKLSTSFINNLEVKDGTAATISEAILQLLEELSIPIEKIMGFGSDGAAVMVGRKTGVATQLKAKNPLLINIHCVAHRFALCVSQAAQKVDAVKKFQETLNSIFWYFAASPVRSNSLKKIQELLEEPQLKYCELHSVRWLSISNAVKVVYRTLKSLIITLEREAEEKDNAKALSLVKKVKEFNFVALVHFMNDVMYIIQRVTKVLQTENLDLSKINPIITTTLEQLKSLKDCPNPFEEDFEKNITLVEGTGIIYKGDTTLKHGIIQQQAFNGVKCKLVDEILKNIAARFPIESLSIITNFDCLMPRCIKRSHIKDKLTLFGKKNMDKLISHYYSILDDALDVKSEYNSLKQLVIASGYGNLSMQEFCSIMHQKHENEFPNMMKLLELALIMPVHTVACERGFSTQNRIKSKDRSLLNTRYLSVLSRISQHGAHISEFDHSKACKIWMTQKPLGRHGGSTKLKTN